MHFPGLCSYGDQVDSKKTKIEELKSQSEQKGRNHHKI